MKGTRGKKGHQETRCLLRKKSVRRIKMDLNMEADNSYIFIHLCSIATEKEDFGGWPRHRSPSAVRSATQERTEERSQGVVERFRASCYVYEWVSL